MSVQLVDQAAAILLDFDGPVCAIFAGYPAAAVADDLRDLVATMGGQVTPAMAATTDPLALLRLSANEAPQLVAALDDALTAAEQTAAITAHETPGAAAFLKQCADRNTPVAIVSNNSRAGVAAYLAQHDLRHLIKEIFGRPSHNPRLMKPHPALVLSALDALSVSPSAAVMIGDSVSDMQVGRLCQVPSIGYANRPSKRGPLTNAGAVLVLDAMTELISDKSRTPGGRTAAVRGPEVVPRDSVP